MLILPQTLGMCQNRDLQKHGRAFLCATHQPGKGTLKKHVTAFACFTGLSWSGRPSGECTRWSGRACDSSTGHLPAGHPETHTHTHHTSLARLKQTTCGGVLEGRFPNEAQSAWEVDGVGLGEGLWLKRGPFLDVDPLYINCRVRLGG